MGTAAVLAGRGVVRGGCIVHTGRDGRYLVPWSSISSLPPIIPGMKRVPDVHGGSGLVLVLSVVSVSPVPIVAVIMRGVVSVMSLLLEVVGPKSPKEARHASTAHPMVGLVT